MTQEFIYPHSFKDIENEATDNRYFIGTPDIIQQMDDRRKIRKLEEIERALFDDIHIILESDRFDFCYFFMKFLEKKQDKVNIDQVKKSSDVLIAGLSRTLEIIKQIMEGEDELNSHELNRIRNTFKMWLFLTFQFLNCTCVRKGKNTIEDQIANALAGNEGQTKKRGNRRNDLSNDYVNSVLEKQKEMIVLIYEILDFDIKFLWNKKTVDQEFYKYFVEVAVRMLESRQLIKKYDLIRTNVFNILEHVVQIEPHTVRNVQTKLINLVYEDDNLVDNVVDFVLKAQESDDSNLANLTTDTIILLTNYVNQQKQNHMNAESQSVKNTKQFLVKIADKHPKIFNTNLSCFIKLYDNEAYHLRNAINEIIGRIISNVLTPKDAQEEENENHMKQKKKLLDQLVARIYDKNAYCRSNVLQVLSELTEDNSVPLEYLQSLLKCGCDRIQDQSANVRKRAIMLIFQVMKKYYVQFVENNRDAKGKFFPKDSIIKDIKFMQTESKQQHEQILKVEAEIETLNEEEDQDRFNQLLQKKQQLRNKIDQFDSYEEPLQEYLGMIETIEAVTPNLVQLLGSKNINDVVETIRLFLFLHKTNIECSLKGIKKMIVLIWSREKSIKEELIKAYWTLFLNDTEYGRPKVARHIVKLFQEATLSEITSLEELLSYIINWNDKLEEKDKDKKRGMFYIHAEVFQNIWKIFLTEIENSETPNIPKMRSAFTILRICTPFKKQIFNSEKLISLVEILKNFLKSRSPDWIIVKEIARITEIVKEINPEYKTIFIKLLLFILIKFQGTEDNEWFIASEAILNMIFAIKNQPESLAQFLILKLTKNLISRQDQVAHDVQTQNDYPVEQFPVTPLKNTQGDNVLEGRSPLRTPTNALEDSQSKEADNGLIFERKLSHLLFIVGHTALKLTLLVDNIESQLKKLKIEGENRQDQKNSSQNEEANELDKVYGGLEAVFEKEKERLNNLAEKTIVQGDNLLGQYKSWLLRIVNDMLECHDPQTRNTELDRVAVLSLCKFMCASSSFTKQNLDILFQILSSKADEIIKTNIVISLGDLLHKFQNLLTPFMDKVYSNLHDPNLQVRKTTMMVLTHLILNDMMKIKGEICEVALLLEDNNESVSNLVKLFLHELHKKDPKLIYNMLPEAIGRMSYENQTKLGAKIKHDSFSTFAKNIMPYLEKGSEALIEKLLGRLESKNPREQKNVSYCLSQLTYNEKGLRLLLDSFENYRLLLQNEDIMDNFKVILAKLKKFQKQETKNLVEEWEAKLLDHTTETFDARRVIPKIKKKVKTKRGRGAKKNNNNDSKSDTENESDDNDDESSAPPRTKAAKKKNKKVAKSTTKRKNKMDVESDDSRSISEVDEDEEDEEEEQEFQVKRKKRLQRGGNKKKNMMEIDEEEEED